MGCFESKEEDRREPTQVRGCTDIFWLVIFALFLCVMVRFYAKILIFFAIIKNEQRLNWIFFVDVLLRQGVSLDCVSLKTAGSGISKKTAVEKCEILNEH